VPPYRTEFLPPRTVIGSMGVRVAQGVPQRNLMKSFDVAIRRFSNQYKDTPGILGVEKDELFSDSILVFFDKQKLKSVIPSEFDGFGIQFYDVQYVLNTSIRFLTLFYEQKVDLTIAAHKNTCEQFVQAVELCRRLLCLNTNQEDKPLSS